MISHGHDGSVPSLSSTLVSPDVGTELKAFEDLLETDANDEVGKVVDLYFRRPETVEVALGGMRMI